MIQNVDHSSLAAAAVSFKRNANALTQDSDYDSAYDASTVDGEETAALFGGDPFLATTRSGVGYRNYASAMRTPAPAMMSSLNSTQFDG